MGAGCRCEAVLLGRSKPLIKQVAWLCMPRWPVGDFQCHGSDFGNTLLALLCPRDPIILPPLLRLDPSFSFCPHRGLFPCFTSWCFWCWHCCKKSSSSSVYCLLQDWLLADLEGADKADQVPQASFACWTRTTLQDGCYTPASDMELVGRLMCSSQQMPSSQVSSCRTTSLTVILRRGPEQQVPWPTHGFLPGIEIV